MCSAERPLERNQLPSDLNDVTKNVMGNFVQKKVSTYLKISSGTYAYRNLRLQFEKNRLAFDSQFELSVFKNWILDILIVLCYYRKLLCYVQKIQTWQKLILAKRNIIRT